ncbi:hypothetical protein [Paraclostridium bifermentans]|uniref:hypothetical protein n=1 Tax=Paraclostridium bifermentans TaxID=1490 RepID=UPI0011DCD16E|nr:hypothetical protein [Paraclostridium bifermentans]
MARKKTNEEFLYEVYCLVEDEYTVVEPYINTDTKIKFKHNKCDNIWKVKPSNFFNGTRCPKCSMKKIGESKQKTTEQFKKDILKKLGTEYEVLGEYKGVFKDIKMVHIKCGREFISKPNILLQGTGCTKCNKMYRPTESDFRREVLEYLGEDYEILVGYKNKRSKVKLLHTKCGEVWETSRHSIVNGARCKCEREYKRKNHDDFVNEIISIHGDEFIFLTEYQGSDKPITFIHTKCNTKETKVASDWLRSKFGCRVCAQNSKKLPLEEMLKRLRDNLGYEYKYIGGYDTTDSKITLLHTKCGREYKVRAADAIQGIGCAKCSNKLPLGYEDIIQRVRDMHGDEYTILSDSIDTKGNIEVIHNTCGHVWSPLVNNFIYGTRCPMCFGNIKKTTEEIKEEIYNLVKDEYEVLSEYHGGSTNITIKHSTCGYIWDITPASFIRQGTRCPRCSLNSKGEQRIFEHLISKNINFVWQDRSQTECRNNKILPFDFGIYDSKNNLKFMIEFQGIQHYEVIEHFGGVNGFENRKLNDLIKKKYCEANNIPLVEISYLDYDNILSILDDELSKYAL